LARDDAVKALKLNTVEGVYQAAKEHLITTKKWTEVGALLFLSKLCRSLIWPSFFVAAGLFGNAIYNLIQNRPHLMGLLEATIGVLLGALLFVPYINLRVEHMCLLYRRTAAQGGPV
jgi:hypothetical protein